MIERVKQDLIEREHAPRSKIETVQAEALVWRDASLGCGKPNASYAQVEVEGYHIILSLDGRQYDYRARRDGHFFLCPPPLERLQR